MTRFRKAEGKLSTSRGMTKKGDGQIPRPVPPEKLHWERRLQGTVMTAGSQHKRCQMENS